MYTWLLYTNSPVYYAPEDGIVPHTHDEVWNEINGIRNGMDRNGIFLPEHSFYRVVSIVLNGT